MWMDADTWFNPLWLETPLDAFLDEVPAHKSFAMGNYRFMNTGVWFVRNSADGRWGYTTLIHYATVPTVGGASIVQYCTTGLYYSTILQYYITVLYYSAILHS
jgi:hypothetical protein